MIGDTLTLSWYFFDWITGDYGGDGEMSLLFSQHQAPHSRGFLFVG